ncbi:hypothetical protein SDC9_167987 [bioreactor metagenome]|uniref:Uncharacterized protein n=1 Tax=bioreactor metagenome TaxID=1076179 RepID=A0A645G1A0_9ZZZZ
MRREGGKQVAQPQPPVRRMQQQGVQLALVVVGEHQVEAGDGRAGHQLRIALLVECQQLVNASRRPSVEGEITRQRWLDVQIHQQHAQPGVGDEAAEIGRGRGLPDAALGRNDGDYLHGV